MPLPKPPACANCQTTTQYAQGGAPQQSTSQMFRSSDGKMRVDTGATSVITDPKAQQAILLDHVTKEARIMPLQPGMPQVPAPALSMAAPGFKPPTPPPMQVQDLGKTLLGGQEVDGKRYIVQPPTAPPLPGAPQVPAAPQAPGMPQLPPKPNVAPMPTTIDVWTSTKLAMPVLTQVTGPFGQQTCACSAAQTAEPHPAMFQIPPGYKPVMPSPPAPSKF
jgi:hypothetical protein